ncbi:MAG: hypothetical protein DMD28_08480 [Gemmatimonadetes bacterium]|nr:MAG: hypothetical protein DMD28_08480 [Gemmatimonadota bacterium]
MRGAVLAGGAARRYGGLPKGLEEIGGRRILDRVADAVAAATGAPPLLVANDPRAPSWRTDLRTVPDVRPGAAAWAASTAPCSRAPTPYCAWRGTCRS